MKKIFAFLICVFLAAVALTYGGCFDSPKPTEEDVADSLKTTWNVYLPENVTLINYSLDAGMRDYAHLYVFEYIDNEEEFLQQLSSERNKDIEKFFTEICESRKEKFNKKYTLPDISEEYFWLYQEKSDKELVTRRLYLLYMPIANQILVYDFKL